LIAPPRPGCPTTLPFFYGGDEISGSEHWASLALSPFPPSATSPPLPGYNSLIFYGPHSPLFSSHHAISLPLLCRLYRDLPERASPPPSAPVPQHFRIKLMRPHSPFQTSDNGDNGFFSTNSFFPPTSVSATADPLLPFCRFYYADALADAGYPGLTCPPLSPKSCLLERHQFSSFMATWDLLMQQAWIFFSVKTLSPANLTRSTN